VTKIIPYIQLARFDHWFKNVFIIPGIIGAIYFDNSLLNSSILINIAGVFIAAGLVASSNYVINEILDAEFDRLHPVKRNRPVPSGLVNIKLALWEWIFFAIAGLFIAMIIDRRIFWVSLSLWLMGCLYNIRPFRTKEKPYLDVLSESVNNPIRFLFGWYGTEITLLPPLSILISYWMIGAFLMAVKRFAEIRRIANPEVASKYRKSFVFYTEERLLVSIMFFASLFALFFGIFLVRYRIELILAAPFIAGFLSLYMKLGFKYDSPVQYPEKLYHEHELMIYVFLCSALISVLFFIDIPIVAQIFNQTYRK